MIVKVIIFLLILPLGGPSVYLYNTEDSSAVEFYDCLSYNSLVYCRRPSQPITLERNHANRECYHNGTLHSFTSLVQNNITVSTVLHEWKSSIEKIEEYSRYKNQPQFIILMYQGKIQTFHWNQMRTHNSSGFSETNDYLCIMSII
jgi:hypothetical protein